MSGLAFLVQILATQQSFLWKSLKEATPSSCSWYLCEEVQFIWMLECTFSESIPASFKTCALTLKLKKSSGKAQTDLLFWTKRCILCKEKTPEDNPESLCYTHFIGIKGLFFSCTCMWKFCVFSSVLLNSITRSWLCM